MIHMKFWREIAYLKSKTLFYGIQRIIYITKVHFIHTYITYKDFIQNITRKVYFNLQLLWSTVDFLVNQLTKVDSSKSLILILISCGVFNLPCAHLTSPPKLATYASKP